jgi:hypothetical protein
LKKQLEGESGIPAKNQALFNGGNELSDPNKMAKDYGVKDGSVLDLEPKSMSVNVTTPDGKKHQVEIKPSDTDQQVKKKIEAKTGMAVPRQVVKFQGKELGPNDTVKSAGIQDGSDLTVDVFKIPVTVNTMDGKKIKFMIDPMDNIGAIKKQLENDSGIPAKNQNLFMNGEEFSDPNKTAEDYGVKKGSVLDLEPKIMKLNVQTPDGITHTVEVKPSDSVDVLKAKVAAKSDMEPHRQLLKLNGKELDGGKSLKDNGIHDGSDLSCEVFKIPVTVKTFDDKTFKFMVEPTAKVDVFKKLIEKQTGHAPKKQCLKYGDEELSNESRTLKQYDIHSGSTLHLSLHADPIIFVDIKCGTLFAVERDEVVAKGILTPNQGNKFDFNEAATDSEAKGKICETMKDCPMLGFSPQVVVAKDDIEDYEMAEAEKVSSVWGVKLKKRERNQKGEEFFFIDVKTGAAGELSRKKYLEMNFITPTVEKGKDTLAEAEKDTMKYDKYILDMRKIFGVKSAT